AFLSKEGALTGLPNPIYGLAFYVIIFAATMYFQKELILYLSAIAVVASLYLAYISYFKQKNFCLVCSSIYLINILIFAFSL
ncbi:MAG TPA: vitamin K epoxide reductase family protein, partial [Candidatus Nanoarchaeia archaeon]|nr:vitamin K epoxide reductase family protein [Candidatus Nanoarchaeia archaeon]